MKQSIPRKSNLRNALLTAMAFLVFAMVVSGLQRLGKAYQGERVNYGDETPHYLNAVVIHDYLAHGLGEDPVAFAARYYRSYPKIALFVWPPFFHATLAGFFLLVGIGESKALVFVALCTVGCAFALFLCLRKQGYPFQSCLTPGLVLLLLPISQHLNTTVMVDSMLALLTILIAWQVARFVDRPTVRSAVLLGLAGAVGCLTKGNALASLAAVPLVLLLSGRLSLLRRKEIYLAGLITAALSAGPLAVAAFWIRKNAIFETWSLNFAQRSFVLQSRELWILLGWLLTIATAASVAAATWRFRQSHTNPATGRTLAISMLSSGMMVNFSIASFHNRISRIGISIRRSRAFSTSCRSWAAGFKKEQNSLISPT